MLKLIKIQGARTNVPEITVVNIDETKEYLAKSLYFVNNGIVSQEPSSIYDIKFIPIETIRKNSGKTTIRGYIVTSEMIFESDGYVVLDEIPVGRTISYRYDIEGHIVGVEDMEAEDALLLCKDEMETAQKVLVALKW